MKKLMNVVEVEGEGLAALLGERVLLFCMNYNYAGKLVGVNEHDVQIEDASMVFETGAFDTQSFKLAEKIPNTLYVRTSAIESYCKYGK